MKHKLKIENIRTLTVRSINAFLIVAYQQNGSEWTELDLRLFGPYRVNRSDPIINMILKDIGSNY